MSGPPGSFRQALTVAKSTIDEVIDADQRLTRLIYAYLASATGWLVVGTLIGVYLSLKFVWPDLGAVSSARDASVLLDPRGE